MTKAFPIDAAKYKVPPSTQIVDKVDDGLYGLMYYAQVNNLGHYMLVTKVRNEHFAIYYGIPRAEVEQLAPHIKMWMNSYMDYHYVTYQEFQTPVQDPGAFPEIDLFWTGAALDKGRWLDRRINEHDTLEKAVLYLKEIVDDIQIALVETPPPSL